MYTQPFAVYMVNTISTACEYWLEPKLTLIECDGTQCDLCIEFNKMEEE